VSGPAGIAAFLHLMAAEPTLMDPAPTAPTAAQIDHRSYDEVHACLRCGGRAQVALVAHTKAGDRWLDLCAGCSHWAQRANELGRDPTGAGLLPCR
jgi:hypothetical protein